MPLANTVLSLSLFWIVVHGLNTYVKRSRQVPLLPSNTTNTQWQSRSNRLQRWSLSNTTLDVKNLHLTVSTTAWNPFYDGMMEKLRTKTYTRTRSWMTIFYDIGFGIGFIGMLCAVCALVWLSGVLFWDLVQMPPRITQTSPLRIQKREVTELPSPRVTVPQKSNIFITPIIPGVTVPLIHLPVILLAVFLCQIFHEFGHAMSAALESISLLSVGASVNVMFPSAHVSFPPRQIENLSPRRKGRIIAGGPWHNIVMWLLLLGIGRTFNIGHIGKAVVNVEEGSPLKDFLLVGSIITHLDDIPLAGKSTGEDIWSSYLSGKRSEDLRAPIGKG
ncbi:hypothetical protein L218DRAFT_543180 [Marasmius fiardii PR-910]|nr:hypothetical protein L218DRAFT_543180 [Marasmius fiardii PR-910]